MQVIIFKEGHKSSTNMLPLNDLISEKILMAPRYVGFHKETRYSKY